MKNYIVSIVSLLVTTVIVSCQSEQQQEFDRYFSAGEMVYQDHCQNCHGDHGQGLAVLIPPLTDQMYLQANRHKLACVLQLGLKGKVTIGGKEFEGQMPPVALSPIEIAQVLTYINNSFGNNNGLINVEVVTKDLAKLLVK